jgi:hypothetical protein
MQKVLRFKTNATGEGKVAVAQAQPLLPSLSLAHWPIGSFNFHLSHCLSFNFHFYLVLSSWPQFLAPLLSDREKFNSHSVLIFTFAFALEEMKNVRIKQKICW